MRPFTSATPLSTGSQSASFGFKQYSQLPGEEHAQLRLFDRASTTLTKESSIMKKTFLGLLASLMVAGALSAVSGLTATTHPAAEAIVMIGDGTSPIPVSAKLADEACDNSSHNK